IARVLVVPDQERFVAELERIARLIATQKGFLVVHKIGVGDWGRIVSGPLQGLEGVIVRCAARWRLSMNVTILGQSVQVDVDRQDVEKIDPPAWALNART
ncbi:MAG TPA: hypothetical protein PLQ89_16660, partial [Phycisphaerae bacterium]|nr:hypothetical protein [Phycisphaerae bacterium]